MVCFQHTLAGGQQPDVFNLLHLLRLDTATHTPGYTIHKHSQPDVLFNLHLLRPNTPTHTPGYTIHKHSQPDVFNLHLLLPTRFLHGHWAPMAAGQPKGHLKPACVKYGGGEGGGAGGGDGLFVTATTGSTHFKPMKFLFEPASSQLARLHFRSLEIATQNVSSCLMQFHPVFVVTGVISKSLVVSLL